ARVSPAARVSESSRTAVMGPSAEGNSTVRLWSERSTRGIGTQVGRREYCRHARSGGLASIAEYVSRRRHQQIRSSTCINPEVADTVFRRESLCRSRGRFLKNAP